MEINQSLFLLGVIDKIKAGDIPGAMLKQQQGGQRFPKAQARRITILRNLTPSIRTFYRPTNPRKNCPMKASTLVLVAVYCMGTSAAFAGGSQASNEKHGPAGIVVGERLVAAKSKLIKQGWKPTPMHTTDGYEYSGVERELAARKFIELDTCSFDSSRCILYYAKTGTCLRVDTLGEQVNDMTVTQWTRECPAAPQ